MAEEKISIFNKRNTILDNLYGLPGVNEILRHKLLDYISRMAKSKTYFSNTTYSIIYNLIQSKKIGLFFIPYLRTSKFLVSNVPIQIVGGYDFNLKRIEIMVKWSFGVDMISQMFEAHIPLICNKVFALILSEALMIYNYKHNGSLVINSEFVKKWYRIYFEGVFGDTLHRTELAKNLATIVSDNYASRIYESVEKAIIENRSPSIVISKKGENTELDIEGIPSIKKGDKELEDIFGDSIEDYVNDKREEYNIDTEGYKELKEFIGEFANLGFFLYKNRELYLNPQNLEAMPETAFETLNKGKLSAEAAQATLHRLEQEHQQKEEAEYQKYLDNNPKIKAALEKTKNEEWDKRTERYFGELTTKYNSEGRAIVGKYAKPPSLQEYINNDSKNNFIQAFMLDSGVATEQDIQDAIDGTKNCIREYERALARYAKINSNPNIDEKTRNNALNILKATEKQAQDVYASFKELFKNRLVDKSLLDKFPKSFKDVEKTNITYDKKRFSGVTAHAFGFNNIFNFAQLLLDNTKEKNKQTELRLSNTIVPNDDYTQTIRSQINDQQTKLFSLSNKLKEQYNLANNSSDKTTRTTASTKIKNIITDIQKVINSSNINSLINQSENDKEIEEHIMQYKDYIKNIPQANKIANELNNLGSNIINSSYYSNQNNAVIRNSILQANSVNKINDILNANNMSGEFIKVLAKEISDVQNIANIAINDKNLWSVAKYGRYYSSGDPLKGELKKWQHEGGKTSFECLEKIPQMDLSNIGIDKSSYGDSTKIATDIEKYLNNRIEKLKQKGLSELAASIKVKDEFINSQVFNEFKDAFKHGDDALKDFERRLISDVTGKSYHYTRSYSVNHILSLRTKDFESEDIKKIKTTINNAGGIKAYIDRRKVRKTTDADLAIIQSIDPSKELTKEQYEALMKFPELFSSLAKYSINSKNVPALLVDKKSFNSAQKGYTRKLFINGLGYLTDCLPEWDTIKYHANYLKNKSIDLYFMLRSIYRFAKIILPLKSNIQQYANQRFGYGIMASYKYFDLAYKLTFKLKKMYELNKGTIRRDMVYSELYMPSTILKKALYAHLVTQNDYTPEILYLINCANKGLEEFM